MSDQRLSDKFKNVVRFPGYNKRNIEEAISLEEWGKEIRDKIAQSSKDFKPFDWDEIHGKRGQIITGYDPARKSGDSGAEVMMFKDENGKMYLLNMKHDDDNSGNGDIGFLILMIWLLGLIWNFA